MNAETDIVLEGYPRSANSYFEAALRAKLSADVRLAHHTHSRGQIDEAVRLGKPCVVLVRNPIDAIVSHLEESERLSSPNVLLREYKIFYNRIRKYNDKIVLVSFESATRDTKRTIDELVARFALSIKSNLGVECSSEEVMKNLTHAAQERVGITPAYRRAQTPEQKNQRDVLRRDIRESVTATSRASLIESANEMYNELRPYCI